MWVFGYGSLMWDGWENRSGFVRRMTAELPGFGRVFNRKSVVNWGTRQNPGPTLNIVPSAGAVCHGVAFNFDDAERAAIIANLEKREGRGFELRGMSVSIPGDVTVEAVVPVYTGKNVFPPLSPEALLQLVRAAYGTSGSCVDYVRGIARELARLGISDVAVEALAGMIDDA